MPNLKPTISSPDFDANATQRFVFRRQQEGLILGEVMGKDDGRVIDWRYVEVQLTHGQ